VPRTAFGVVGLLMARVPIETAANKKGRPSGPGHKLAILRRTMNIDLIPIGEDPPHELNVIIEVPVGGEPVKYEFDKKSGALFVDRILHTPMRYPANYGFVPHTLSPDGDPLDALVVARSPFIPGCVVRVRPIAVLKLEDEAGGDEKLLTVPVDSTFPYYSKIEEMADLPEIVMQQIEHFFTHYKDLEKKKWVRIGNWGDTAEAKQIIVEAIEFAKKKKAETGDDAGVKKL
jgi:inorganic pyrophosphatase